MLLSGIATIYTLRRFYIFMRRTTPPPYPLNLFNPPNLFHT